MKSITYRFFMLPSETVDLLQQELPAFAASVYRQLDLPGDTLDLVQDIADLPRLVDLGRPPVMIHVTHQKLATGPTDGTFDGNVPGVVVVWMPFQTESIIGLGSVGARIQPGHEDDASVARVLVRSFRRAAPPKRLAARSLTTGDTGQAGSVGCSDAVLDLLEKGVVKLRQWGVANVEYVALSSGK